MLRTETISRCLAAVATMMVAAGELAAWKNMLFAYASLLDGKIVVDPSNPLSFDATGQIIRTLPDDQSAAPIVTSLLPAAAHSAKAFGTLDANALATGANREPQRAVLFYTTDDDAAATTVKRLTTPAGFDALKVGGVAEAGRVEGPRGDLTQFGMNGELVVLDQARAAIAARKVMT